MDLTSVKTVKDLLKKHQVELIKIMGQNFLVDKPTLVKIIKAAELNSEDAVLEIGPGIGTLTQALLRNAGMVVAVEKSREMIGILKETLGEKINNITVVEGDALKLNPSDHGLENKKYKIVANIPYYLTSPLIRKFLEEKNRPSLMVLMVQKEVAQRIYAKPPKMSLLAVSVQFYAEAQIISYVSKSYFWPSPKVDSAIIKITPHLDSMPKIDPDLFFKVVRSGFSQPRKQLLNNLSSGLKEDKDKISQWLSNNDIKPTQRAETLNIKEWERLTDSYEQINYK